MIFRKPKFWKCDEEESEEMPLLIDKFCERSASDNKNEE